MWETVTFLLYGFVFIVIGLEMPLLLVVTPSIAIRLVGIGVIVSRVLVVVPALLIFAAVFVPPLLADGPTHRARSHLARLVLGRHARRVSLAARSRLRSRSRTAHRSRRARQPSSSR